MFRGENEALMSFQLSRKLINASLVALNLFLLGHNRNIINKEGRRHQRRCRLANEDQGHSLTGILGEHMGSIKSGLLPILRGIGIARFLQPSNRLAVAIQ